MPNCKQLVLIPTEAERMLCGEKIAELCRWNGVRVELCGWGLVQSAILSTMLIRDHEPEQICLVGIAGSLLRPGSTPAAGNRDTSGHDRVLQIGSAYEFGSVEIDGIGVGQGTTHVSFEQLGWRQLFGGPDCPGGRIEFSIGGVCHLPLLSVCSASANVEEAARRADSFPNAAAEDMETYSVASTCHQLQVPLRVFRGISNQAGDRVHSNWQSARAMQSALRLAIHALRA